MEHTPHPGKFRWRLTFAFILASGLSAGALGAISVLLLHQDREDQFLERARDRVDAALASNDESLAASGMWRGLYGLSERLRKGTRADAVFVRWRGTSASDPSILATNLSAVLRESLPEQRNFTSVIDVDGESNLVVARTLPESEMDLYFLFSRSDLSTGFSRLIGTMLTSWLVVVLLAALLGSLLARRTLQPVARAADAARSLAEGLLDTRLPEEPEDEFGAWAASFNRMAAALQEKIEALSNARDRERRFTADVSHELRTPLTAVVSAASMLKEHLHHMPTEARWPAERLVDEVMRLRSLVEELMEIARLDSGRERVLVDLIAIRERIGAVIATRNWSDDVTIEAGEEISIVTDRRRLERVLGNLIENAVSHAKGNVQVHARRDGESVLIDIVDEGPGIDPEHLPHIFDRFYKSDAARTGGSGLGLSIARQNAKLLGGDIVVASSRDSGTCFTVRLPMQSRRTSGRTST